MRKSDLLTYSGVQTRPSHVFTFYSHACSKRRYSLPSESSGGYGPGGSVNDRPAVILVPGGGLFSRRSTSSSLCFRVAICHLCVPKVVTEGLVLRPFASERPFVSFVYRRWSPKVLVFKLVLLSDPSSPSGTLTLFLLEPCKRVREHFRGCELDPEVQSPTVAPRGRGPKTTVRTLVNEEDCV